MSPPGHGRAEELGMACGKRGNEDSEMNHGRDPDVTSLDALERVDLELKDLFRQVVDSQGPSVEQRYRYGVLVKEALHQLAVRQASVVDVAVTIDFCQDLSATATGLLERATACRSLIDELGDMARGVQPIWLNVGQDFDTPFRALADLASSTIEWELSEAIPLIRKELGPSTSTRSLRSAKYVQSHAPLRLDPSGPRWYERAPVISRITTIYQRVREIQI